ncbi:MAG: alpha/beta hydrolase, partial [Flavobacteriales bacterium]|nr:alpha/beta hydrolase [Flavobacteriales bacterium]
DMDELYEDAAELLAALETGPVHFGGLSMGGFIGMRLAARKPEMIRSLILMETSALDEPNRVKYTILNTLVRLFGIKVAVKPVMKIMFGQTFLNDPQRIEEVKEWTAELTKNKRTIVRAVDGVVYRKGVEDELINIKCPTLIMVGLEDIATTVDRAEYLHTHIAGSQLIKIPHAGHTASIEEADAYNEAMASFLHSLKKSTRSLAETDR